MEKQAQPSHTGNIYIYYIYIKLAKIPRYLESNQAEPRELVPVPGGNRPAAGAGKKGTLFQ